MTMESNGPAPEYDIVLTDENGIQLGLPAVGTNGEHDPTAVIMTSVERSSLKTSSGNQSYSDLEPPYTVLAQSDWSGGRGAKSFEDDVTRFADSCRANTGRAFRVFLNGRESYGTGVRNANTHLPGSMRMIPLANDQTRLAVRFQASASYTADKVFHWLAVFGEPAGTFTVRLCADGLGGTTPGTVLQSKTITHADLDTASLSEMFPFDIANQALTVTTYYWLEVYATTSDVAAGTYWKVGVSDTPGATKQSQDGGVTWQDCPYDLYYRVADDTATLGGKFFEYKRALYFVTKPTDGSASKLYKNGVHGACIANTGSLNLLKAGGSPGWATNRFAGCVVLLLEGPGSSEEQPWRMVTANDASTLTVDTNWLIEHTTATSFVILGEDVWTECTWVNFTKTVTSVVVTEFDIMYFGFGDGTQNARKARERNNAGNWVTEKADSTFTATLMETYYSGTTQKIVRSNGGKISDVNAPNAYTTDPTFGTEKNIGSPYEKISGMIRYVDGNGNDQVWIFKESGPWVWNGSDVVNNSREEMKPISSEVMGRAAAKSDVYLFFSAMDTVWRFYDPTFDDVGPMLDEGLPANRQGVVSAIRAYPGRTYIAIDAGSSGYSTVMETTGGRAWHEVYRAPKGERITAMRFQVVPGMTPDRLWVQQGADFVRIPFPSSDFDPMRDSSYQFTHEGMVQLASMHAGLIDAWKYWKKLKLQVENQTQGACWVEADYRLDDGDWQTMPEAFTGFDADGNRLPLEEREFGDGQFGVSSKKFDLRLRLVSVNSGVSPEITAVIINGVTVAEPKYTYTLSTKLEDKNLNYKADPTLTAGQKTALVDYGVAENVSEIGDTLTPTQKAKLLRAWSGRAQSLWMTSTIPLYDGLAVFVAPPPLRNLTVSEQEQEYTYSATITLQEA